MLKVPAEVLRKATKCGQDFSCLKTGQCGDRPICGVESTHGEGVLCVRAAEGHNCPYHLDFGGAGYCVCPVRCAIYQQQGI